MNYRRLGKKAIIKTEKKVKMSQKSNKSMAIQ